MCRASRDSFAVDLSSHGDRTVVKRSKNVARRGSLATRNGEACTMNATATITPAGPQHMRALARANEVRLARAELKRRVGFGKIDVAEVILDCPWEAHSMAVADLLMSQRRWGQTRCRKLLTQIPMSEKKTVGSMTDRQRRALAAMLSSADGCHAWSADPLSHGQPLSLAS
jgi:hypothetical protein